MRKRTRSGIEGDILAEPIVGTGKGVVAEVGPVGYRQHVPLFGVEQEHQTQDDRQQGAVDFVGVLCERPAQKPLQPRNLRAKKAKSRITRSPPPEPSNLAAVPP